MYKVYLFDIEEDGVPILVFGYYREVLEMYTKLHGGRVVGNFIEYTPGDGDELNKVILESINSWQYIEVHNLLNT
jgi:hypothetical protein